MNDRIKLAEAMYPEKKWCVGYPLGYIKDGEKYHLAPDPENDADDDYAVLEWAWKNIEEGTWTDKQWDTFKDYWREERGDWNVWNYTKGVFAKAALKVLENA